MRLQLLTARGADGRINDANADFAASELFAAASATGAEPPVWLLRTVLGAKTGFSTNRMPHASEPSKPSVALRSPPKPSEAIRSPPKPFEAIRVPFALMGIHRDPMDRSL